MNKKSFLLKKEKILQVSVLFFILLFLMISYKYINPDAVELRSDYRSSELREKKTKDGNIERTDYYDNYGHLTIAGDLGYATCIVTDNGRETIEKYYDDKGVPISSYLLYYAINREYDEEGNLVKITYLNDKDNPTKTYYGYAIEERKYNSNKQVTTVKYYDNLGNPVCTTLYAYGKINEYDENGKINQITYIDNSGRPMKTGLGYAIIKRTYYNTDSPWNGKVESEQYFDQDGYPVSLNLGQYGIHKEYDDNGLEAVLTYLDAAGEPIVTNKGYTTVIRTFQTNNTVATEKYFGIDGKPFALSEGQYGIKKENGQTVFLNKKGDELINLKKKLYNDSRIVIILAIIINLISACLDIKYNILLLILYVISMVYMTLMFREKSISRWNSLLASYCRVFIDTEARSDILRNIWLFIPFGAILYKFIPNKMIFVVPVVFSITIEGIQFLTETGICELDDVISNTLGGIIGYFAAKLTDDVKQRINSWEHFHILKRR